MSTKMLVKIINAMKKAIPLLQSQFSIQAELNGGHTWSPRTKRDGSRDGFYDNMARVKPGGIVFSFKYTQIVAIGIIGSKGLSSAQPTDFG
jgi:hypothetical protein